MTLLAAAPVRPGFRPAPVGPRKAEEAGKLRRLAERMDRDHPETVVGGHLRDAAKALDRGSVKAASRHLAVARHTLTPQQLYRHGVTRGIDHTTARLNAGEVDRRMLALRDIHDQEQDNATHRQFRLGEQSAAEAEKARQKAETAALPNRIMGTAPMRPGESSSPHGQAGQADTPGQKAGTSLAAWHHAQTTLLLSAETARLAVTPAPRGRPGGPGLYDVKGMGHTPYLQQIVKALIEKRGMLPGRAYAIARASIRKWAVKSKHPEVAAASGAAEAGELAKQARAKASHGHANDDLRQIWDLAWRIADAVDAIELAGAVPVGGPGGGGNPNQSRQADGKFGSGGTPAAAPAAKAPAQPKAPPMSAAQKAAAKQAMASPPKNATPKQKAKFQLQQKISTEKLQLAGLAKTLTGLKQQEAKMAAASAQATQAGTTGKTASSTPAQVKQATTSNSPTPASSTSSSSSSSSPSSGSSTPTAQQIQNVADQITTTQKQMATLQTSIRVQSAQLKKL